MEEQGIGLSPPPEVMLNPAAKAFNLFVRHSSIHSIRSPSVASLASTVAGAQHLQTADEDDDENVSIWGISELRKRFKNKELESLYAKYQQRLMHVNLKAYLITQMALSLILILILLSINADKNEKATIPEVIGQLVLFLMSVCLSVVFSQEKRVQEKPRLYLLASIIVIFCLVGVDLALSFYFNDVWIHVAASMYSILVVYNLLPLTLIWHSYVFGFIVSLVHILTWAFFVSPAESPDVSTVMADLAFHLAANGVCSLTRGLHEITLRRAFLDRRKCIDTTIKFEYEKSQEEQLMLSILPKHIASEVREDIRQEIHQLMMQQEGHQRNNNKTSSSSAIPRKPFDKLYVEEHRNVTVLYADIVNFTPLTTTLPSGNLVALLNELFGKFDEAAKETNCLRIKILGDCYYCVSGLPDSTTDHAKNCVEMGLRMVDIIKQLREDHKVDVDMRIGVHSGSVISGLLGLRKWQFDIWSRDVTIANHMEQSGRPGRVHISMSTRSLLDENDYDFEPGFGDRRDSYLAKFGIVTFLVSAKKNKGNDINKNEDDVSPSEELRIERKRSMIQLDQFDGPMNPSSTDSSRRTTTTTDSEASTLPADDDIQHISTEILIGGDDAPEDGDDAKSTGSDSLYVATPTGWSESSYYAKKRSSVLSAAGFHFPSLSHSIYTSANKRMPRSRKSSQLVTWDENQEEIYSRVVANKTSRGTISLAGGVGKMLSKRRSTVGESSFRRGAVLMDSSLVNFRRMMDQADSKMENAIETMNLSKFDHAADPRSGLDQSVNWLLLFRQRSWELPFILRKDSLFNLYILGAIPVLLGVGLIQLSIYWRELNQFWIAFGTAVAVVALAALISWSPFIRRCLSRRSSNADDDARQDSFVAVSSRTEEDPSEDLSDRNAYWWNRFNAVRESLPARVILFFVVTISVGSCSVADMGIVIHSASPPTNNNTDGRCTDHDPRIYLWYFTYSSALTMTMAFAFYRIHFLIKLAVYITTTVVYSVLLSAEYPRICQLMFKDDDEAMSLCYACNFSPAMSPIVVHIVYICSVVVILHVTDRQIEFIHRLDYIWQRQLVREQEEANTTRMVNKLLLLNILPLHVAEVYLDTSRSSDELYHEDYKYVAVMFASIPNFMDQYYAQNDDEDSGLKCLEVLNQIISGFDALSFEGPFSRIEKIKLVGSTYMAACGLSAKRNGLYGSIAGNVPDDATPLETIETAPGSSLAIAVRFVAAMMGVLERLNAKNAHNFKLRTGIDYGPVIAGVVGAQKPLYDIWGDTVNMASRLEYTGELDKIQVTEKTARLIESEGIRVERRGETYLKGKGMIMTYWVHPDKSSFYETLKSARSTTACRSSSSSHHPSVISLFNSNTPETLLLPALFAGLASSSIPESCASCPSRSSCGVLSASSRPRTPLSIPEEDENNGDVKSSLPLSTLQVVDIEDFCTHL